MNLPVFTIGLASILSISCAFFESEDKFVDGTYQSDENLLNNISTLNKHGA